MGTSYRTEDVSGTRKRAEEVDACHVRAGESRGEDAIFIIWNTDVQSDPLDPGNGISYPKFFLTVK